MIYVVLFPGVAFVLMIIIFAIFAMIRYGPQLCHVRHHTLPQREVEDHTGGYAHSVSYDV